MLLRPSNAYRWSRCAGSLALAANYPEGEEGAEAREGTAAHWYGAEAFEGRLHAAGTLAPNGVPITEEMIESALVWWGDAQGELALASANHTFRVEQKLTMHGLIHPECEGTPDAFLVDGVRKVLIVWDFKHGHRYVDPFYNEQGTCYLAGVFEAFELTEDDLKSWRVELRIVQPRNYKLGGPVRVWTPTIPALFANFCRLSAMAEMAQMVHAPTQTGEQCRDCPGRHACAALQRVGAYAIDLAGQPTPVELPPVALALELKLVHAALDRLRARATGLEEVVLGLIRAGQSVPGWGIEHGQSREKWTLPDDEVFTLGDLFGVELRKVQPITPTQARKAGLPPEAVKGITERPPGKGELAILDETAIAKVFQ